MSGTISNPPTVSTAPQTRPSWAGFGYLALGVFLGLGLVAANRAVYAVEGGMSEIATLLPLGYAFAAGMVATVNPCGVLLLPSLVAFYLGQGTGPKTDGLQRAGQAVLLGIVATLGFVVIFAVVGTIFGIGGHALGNAFPIGGMLVGAALVVVGGWLALTGRELGVAVAGQAMGYVRLGRDLRSMFLFGIAYAIASLACTLPIFLVVVGSALATSGIGTALGRFVSYSLGMGLVLTIVVVGAAFFQGLVNRSVRRAVPYVHHLAASFLIGAGIYLVSYWLSASQIAV